MKYTHITLFALLLAACNSAPVSDPPGEQTMAAYQELYRPQIHFSPPANWMNDPNGMVYYDGEYHLFYQYYPDSTVWGPMHWGHAVSTDLVQWEHLPIALYPDSLGYIFSGSAVVDEQNTSGLGTAENPPLVAIFTHHDPVGAEAGRNDYQVQSIAYSLDRGRTWTKYPGNPVVPNPGIIDFRDPKVSRHKATQQWFMIFAAKDRVRIYTSPNLIDWNFASEFGANFGDHGGVWECPDLFPLPVDDDPARTKWVLLLSINPGGPNGGSATQYFVGNFDGKTFTLDPGFADDVRPASTNPDDEQAVWLDYGPDNYAGVTFSDIPTADGRRLFMGWMSNWNYAQVVPTAPWRSAMTLPRALSLKETTQGLRVFSTPVQELERLRNVAFTVPGGPTEGEQEITAAIPGGLLPLEISLLAAVSASGPVASFGLKLYNDRGESLLVGYEPAQNRYFIDRSEAGPNDFSDRFSGRSYAPKITPGTATKLHLYIDEASIELFADDGASVLTGIFFPSERFDQIALFTEGGAVDWQEIKGWSLKSIWDTDGSTQ